MKSSTLSPDQVDSALSTLRELKGCQRAMVIVLEAQHPVVKGSFGGAEERLVSRNSMSGQMLRRSIGTNRDYLVRDSSSDPTVRDWYRPGEPRSLLCVPVPSSVGLQGVLYADAPEAGGFTRDDHAEITKMAKRLGWEMDKSEALIAESRPSLPIWVQVSLLLGLVLLLALSIGAFFTPDPVPRTVQAKISTPSQVASGFKASVQTRNFSGAYTFLSQRLKQEIPREEFVSLSRAWLKKPDRAWELQHRRVSPGEASELQSTLHLYPPDDRPEQRKWTWQLIREDDGWKLDRFKGGPLSGSGARSGMKPG
jgi:hypothetical protein